MGTSDRRPYQSASVLDQALLDQCQDNLTGRLEMIAEIYDVGSPARTLYLSDRAKYVDGKFYLPRVRFPVIERTLGDWLAGELEFSTLELTINNSDGFYDELMPSGSAYNNFIGKSLSLQIGLAELGSSYTKIFSGRISDVSGFKRDTASFTVLARSDFERANNLIPASAFIRDDWPDIEDNFVGLAIPIIYGDWTTSLRPEAPEIPLYPVNGANVLVNGSFDPPDPNVGSVDLRLVIASVPLKSVDINSITLFRGSSYYIFDSSDISIVPGSNNQAIDIAQKNLLIDTIPWIYETGDEFYCRCVGVDLGTSIFTGLSLDSNAVSQAYDILSRFGGIAPSEFDPTWVSLRDKLAPAQSAVASIKSRVWQQEERKSLELALSLLEQVRLEAFISRQGFFSLTSLHFEDFIASPTFTVRNWDIVRGSLQPSTDDRNIFNRAKADYAYSPPIQEARLSTALYRNEANITQIGREISKLLTFPNLYIESDVIAQLKEILRFAAYVENIELRLTSRGILLELGNDVTLDIDIGSIKFSDALEPVTGKIRKISYDPTGLTLPVVIWSWQMVPYPGSEKIGINGITGGYNAVITQET